MSGNFVRERQRIVYIYNIHMYIIYVNNTLPLAHEISRHFWAAYVYMQNCKLLESAMPNMQVLKFYFPVKESTIAQLECLTVDTFT